LPPTTRTATELDARALSGNLPHPTEDQLVATRVHGGQTEKTISSREKHHCYQTIETRSEYSREAVVGKSIEVEKQGPRHKKKFYKINVLLTFLCYLFFPSQTPTHLGGT
jgi:hypothetical protein